MAQEPGDVVVFRQLFDRESCTYTYLLASEGEAVLIDPVEGLEERDAALIKELDLKLRYALNTHAHADHITATCALKDTSRFPHLAGHESVLSTLAGGKADKLVEPGEVLTVGRLRLKCLATPGHTSGCTSYLLHVADEPRPRAVFTGDALFVRGCGRTDFQGGSAERLYDSVHSQLFTLPDEVAVYPAHDYNGRTVSSIGEEKRCNPRLAKSKEEFVRIMDDFARSKSKPEKLDENVPINLNDGKRK